MQRDARRAVIGVGIMLLLALPATAHTLQGEASWYGPRHHGRLMADGHRFDMHAPTLAHRTLPLGQRVRVENLRNGRTVRARVTDRGPYARGRVADLSRHLAERLDMLRAGTAPVRITVLEGRR